MLRETVGSSAPSVLAEASKVGGRNTLELASDAIHFSSHRLADRAVATLIGSSAGSAHTTSEGICMFGGL